MAPEISVIGFNGYIHSAGPGFHLQLFVVAGVFILAVKSACEGTEAHPPIITSYGPDGRRKFVPRSWFSFRVAGTSKSETFTVRDHELVLQ